MKKQEIQKIGFILFGLLEDVLMRTPLLETIHHPFPKAKMYIFVDPIGKEVLQYTPYISEIFVIDRSKKNRLKYIFHKLTMQIKLISLRLDLLIDLYGGSSARNAMKLSFTKYQIGFKNWQVYTNKKLKLTSIYDPNTASNPFHLTVKTFPLLSFLDIDYNKLSTRPVIYIPDTIQQKINILDKYYHYNKSYLLSLGTGDIKKMLPLETSAKLIKYIYNTYNLTPLIIKNPSQEYLQEEIVTILQYQKTPYYALDYFSIIEIAALMKNMKFAILPDTGLFHLAVGVNIPIFSYFTYTHPKLVEPKNHIYQFCYHETEKKDLFGLPKCTQNISFEKLQKCFNKFANKLHLSSKELP